MPIWTRRTIAFVLLLCCATTSPADDPPWNVRKEPTLPQDHEYQKTLHKFMATLTEKDFDHGVSGKIPGDTPTSADPEYLYRQHMLSLMHQPLVGNKRGAPAVNAPPRLFTLASIETPKGVMQPPVWPETLIPLVQWDYPGNVFRNNRALKLRAFVTASVLMTMFDNFAEINVDYKPPIVRPDWHGYQLVYIAAGYPGFKDVLPPDVQKAFEAGLKRIGERMLGWGARGESCEHDMIAPVGLICVSRAINDPAFTKAVEDHVRKLFTDPRYFHPAGYWVERGGVEIGFGGSANWFAVWAALMTDWAFTKDPLDRIYRLRGHLILPEPDGKLAGPSHFNSRLGGPASVDQWAWDGARETAASMITDEAAQFVKTPSPEDLKSAPAKRAHHFNEDMGENPRVVENGVPRYINSDEISSYPWQLRMWMTYNFPASVNPGYEFYRPGAFARRQELERKNSPLLKSPFLRGENFIRDFEKAFVIARQPGYAAIVHTGPIGHQSPDDNMHQFLGPLGLGGGQLSAFWTPTTGSVLLGQRRWMSYDKTYDLVEEWRIWPIHAVSGATADGTFFTSARIQNPNAAIDVQGSNATIKLAGTIPASVVGQAKTIAGKYDYARALAIDDKGVSVETTISGDGKEQIAELYETLPVYLRDAQSQAQAKPTVIELQIGGKWTAASDQYAEKVQAVRLTRFTGAVIITFDQPRRVKLSPADWEDNTFSKANSRNVMIDLLESGDKPVALKEAKKVSYRITPTAG